MNNALSPIKRMILGPHDEIQEMVCFENERENKNAHVRLRCTMNKILRPDESTLMKWDGLFNYLTTEHQEEYFAAATFAITSRSLYVVCETGKQTIIMISDFKSCSFYDMMSEAAPGYGGFVFAFEQIVYFLYGKDAKFENSMKTAMSVLGVSLLHPII